MACKALHYHKPVWFGGCNQQTHGYGISKAK